MSGDTVDHKRLGVLYISTPCSFLSLAYRSDYHPHPADAPAQHFGFSAGVQSHVHHHGTTMIFFVAMPILFGFANYLSAMISAREIWRSALECLQVSG